MRTGLSAGDVSILTGKPNSHSFSEDSEVLSLTTGFMGAVIAWHYVLHENNSRSTILAVNTEANEVSHSRSRLYTQVPFLPYHLLLSLEL